MWFMLKSGISHPFWPPYLQPHDVIKLVLMGIRVKRCLQLIKKVRVTPCSFLWLLLFMIAPFVESQYCVSIIHQQGNTSAVICTLLYSSQCKFDIFFKYCNCANTHLMFFFLAWTGTPDFWRSNWEDWGEEGDREWGILISPIKL